MNNLEYYMLKRNDYHIWCHYVITRPLYTCPIYITCPLNKKHACGQGQCLKRFRKWAAESAVIDISDQQAIEIIRTKVPRGLFRMISKTDIVGIDNINGNAWVMEFTSEETCDQWLQGHREEHKPKYYIDDNGEDQTEE